MSKNFEIYCSTRSMAK